MSNQLHLHIACASYLFQAFVFLLRGTAAAARAARAAAAAAAGAAAGAAAAAAAARADRIAEAASSSERRCPVSTVLRAH